MKGKILSLLLLVMLFIASCGDDPGPVDTCEADQAGDLTIINVTSGVDGVALDLFINGNPVGVTLPPGGEHFESQLAAGPYEIEGRSPTNSFIKDINLLVCDDLGVQLGN